MIRVPGRLSWLTWTLGFLSGGDLMGHNPMGCGMKPHVGPHVELHTQQGLCVEFSPSAFPLPHPVHTLSLSNKYVNLFEKNVNHYCYSVLLFCSYLFGCALLKGGIMPWSSLCPQHIAHCLAHNKHSTKTLIQ